MKFSGWISSLFVWVAFLPPLSGGACCKVAPQSDDGAFFAQEALDGCFCYLRPGDCEALIPARVVSVGDQTATLEVLGAPFHDPKQLLSDGQLLEDLGCKSVLFNPFAILHVGDTGIFVVDLPDECSTRTPADARIRFAVLEVDGKYLCELADWFPGVAADELVRAVLGGDGLDCWSSMTRWINRYMPQDNEPIYPCGCGS